jgi:hypothetical protein
MTLNDAQRLLDDCLAKRTAGTLDAAGFAAAVRPIKAQDDTGRWWAPDPTSGAWLTWDGQAWRPAMPSVPTPPPVVTAPPIANTLSAPTPAATTAVSSAPPASTRTARPTAVPTATPPAGRTATEAQIESTARRLWGTISSRLMSPDAFFEEGKRVPLGKRSQAWWDALSIAGGACGGYLWFVYGAVRGMPHLRLITTERETWFDLLPAFLLLALPLLLFPIRRTVAHRLTTGWNAFTGMTQGRKIGLLAAAALAFGAFNFDSTFVFSQREGLDYLTPIIMTGLPMVLAFFRKETDHLLQPVQQFRQRVPRGAQVGIALAMPFAVAWILYAIGFNQYPLLHLNIVFGTLLSYAVLRTPNLVGGASSGHGSGTPFRVPPVMMIGLAMVACWLLSAHSAWADDFLRDPFNFRDGLRTDGIAEVLSGVATSVVSILVNGVEVTRVIIQDRNPVKEGETPVQTQFVVIVNTADAKGARSTTLDQMMNGTIFCYAHCEEVGKGRFPAGDDTIAFSLESESPWVVLKDLGNVDGQRCARVTFASPAPSGDPPQNVVLVVSAGVGTLIRASVPLDVVGGYELQIF